MGDVRPATPALLIVAAFSRYPDAFAWAREQCEQRWGTVALASPSFSFSETDYYEPSMGGDLLKTFWAFERLIAPDAIAQIKLETNRLEESFAKSASLPVARPLNLDPGYITEAKLVLASTKDHAHRIYLTDGIFAEVTLYYHRKQWRHREWTFPDYRRQDYHEFFDLCRGILRERRRGRS